MSDFSDLKEGDRVHIRFMSVLLKNLRITKVDSKCLIVEDLYPFSRSTGQPCDSSSDFMKLVRRDNM